MTPTWQPAPATPQPATRGRAVWIVLVAVVVGVALIASTRGVRPLPARGRLEINVWAPRDVADHATDVAAMTARGLGVFEEQFGA